MGPHFRNKIVRDSLVPQLCWFSESFRFCTSSSYCSVGRHTRYAASSHIYDVMFNVKVHTSETFLKLNHEFGHGCDVYHKVNI